MTRGRRIVVRSPLQNSNEVESPAQRQARLEYLRKHYRDRKAAMTDEELQACREKARLVTQRYRQKNPERSKRLTQIARQNPEQKRKAREYSKRYREGYAEEIQARGVALTEEERQARRNKKTATS